MPQLRGRAGPVSVPLPPVDPKLISEADRFHASCAEILDRYVSGIELDANRHAVKHGPLDETKAHHDVTKILLKDIPPGMLAGMLAEAILRGIARKRKGRG